MIIKKVLVKATINNLPDREITDGYIVARRDGADLWYYGNYDTEARSREVAEVLNNGVVLEVSDIKDVIAEVKGEAKDEDFINFAHWVADRIFDSEGELGEFAEFACRKLYKLGIVIEDGDKWRYDGEEVDDE